MSLLTKKFLIVDDDPLNNILSKMILRKSLGEVDIKEFVVPELALDYIEVEFEHKQHFDKTTLFLDLNMPSLTGWDFLEKFKNFPKKIKDHFTIYMLSSSVDPSDLQRAKLNPLISDFLEKPLKKDTIIKMFS